MSSFEENEIKIAEIRKKALGTSKTKEQVDKEIKEYFETKVIPLQTKFIGNEKSASATEDETINKYYTNTVVAARKKLIGK
jgi:hypothetical protein